jgi:hypothetical protein
MATIPAPDKPLTRFEAQRKLGLVAGLDLTVMGLILFSWMTMGFWKFFGNPEPIHLVVMAIVNVVLMQAWIIVLCYRVMVFVLDLGADINLLPESAARIVLGYWEGRSK